MMDIGSFIKSWEARKKYIIAFRYTEAECVQTPVSFRIYIKIKIDVFQVNLHYIFTIVRIFLSVPQNLQIEDKKD